MILCRSVGRLTSLSRSRWSHWTIAAIVVAHALAHPLSTLPLTDLCGTGSRVTVVIAIAGNEHAAANAIMAAGAAA